MALSFPRSFANIVTGFTSYIEDNFNYIISMFGAAGGFATLDGSGELEQNAKTATLAAVATTTLSTVANSLTDGTNIIHTKIIDIGDWNMDLNIFKVVSHGLTDSKIRSVSATIIRNDSAYFSDLQHKSTPSGVDDGFWYFVDGGGYIQLNRTTGGGYDSVDYNSTSFNRGYIVITYVD